MQTVTKAKTAQKGGDGKIRTWARALKPLRSSQLSRLFFLIKEQPQPYLLRAKKKN